MRHHYYNTAAKLSTCQRYRYTLAREWTLPLAELHKDRGTCLWIMLNPSTADGSQDDPTIRRCVGFSREWGYSGLLVVNLFALRSTDPRQLYTTPEPVGPENDGFITASAKECQLTVCAWGTHGAFMNRGAQVLAMLGAGGHSAHHLGLTADGHPKHPLYLPGTATPVRFGGEG